MRRREGRRAIKLPRWLVGLMLASSVLGVLGAAAGWWATWPQRTARVFVDFMAAGRLDEVENITRPHPGRAGHLVPHNLRGWTQSNLERASRSLFDVIVGRQRFRMPGLPATTVNTNMAEEGCVFVEDDKAGVSCSFTVMRGRVFDEDRTWDEWFTPVFRAREVDTE